MKSNSGGSNHSNSEPVLATQQQLSRTKNTLSPLISYIVNDPSYTLSPAANRNRIRPSTAGSSRSSKSKFNLPSSKSAKQSTERALIRLVKNLRQECELWKEKRNKAIFEIFKRRCV